MTDAGRPGAEQAVAVGARAVYDAIAVEYERQLGTELDGKPLDRALLTGFLELVGDGVVGDVGCGPGHVARFLADRHPNVLGVDLSSGMVSVAKRRAPRLAFTVGSMLRLPISDRAWAGAVALYSIIHLTADERAAALREFARVLRPDGWLLLAFHVDSPDFAAGDVNQLTTWFGHHVQLDGHFLHPGEVIDEMKAAGFTLVADVRRRPTPTVEYSSSRCYLIAQRCAPDS